MQKKILPKRQPVKILACHLEATADAVRKVVLWTICPNLLDWDRDKIYNSGDIVEQNLTMSVVVEKIIHFIKNANELNSPESRPDFIIWDAYQLDILTKLIPNLPSMVKNITFLQKRTYDIFKYTLSLQSFGVQDIAGIMGIKEVEEYLQFANIAINIERELKQAAIRMKNNAKKNNKEA